MIGRVWAPQRLISVSVSCGFAHYREVGLEFRAFHKGTACSWYGGARYRIITRGFDQPSSLLLLSKETRRPC